MGTRHLIRIVDDTGALRLSQYGQFDGYPGGQGRKVLDFLHSLVEGNGLEVFSIGVKRLKFLTKEQIHNIDNGTKSSSDLDPIAMMPWLSRNTSAAILPIICAFAHMSDGFIHVVNDESFGEDDVMCEWIWTIDLKQQMFIGQTDLKHPPLASFPLSNLPDEDNFLAVMAANAEAQE